MQTSEFERRDRRQTGKLQFPSNAEKTQSPELAFSTLRIARCGKRNLSYENKVA
ncbi:MAG: hypothetical protein AAF939_08180 [Planctomycetota bacterium]